ncbi:hypothetical protein [Phaeodactylibacter xiamenensis]|mgnify:CR=1 FL=1|jgi:hypothetical protein|uniref:hypothetical protein n=1 Tax=Phaeodactylibacter xiamenensis TaxID=1524460 RepID=UPI0024A9C252|nr:hypothetical protein [Phaeodactylibacter xiamenensis]
MKKLNFFACILLFFGFASCDADYLNSEYMPSGYISQFDEGNEPQAAAAGGKEEFGCVTDDDQAGTKCMAAASNGCKKISGCVAVSSSLLEDFFTREELEAWPNVDIKSNKAFMEQLRKEKAEDENITR